MIFKKVSKISWHCDTVPFTVNEQDTIFGMLLYHGRISLKKEYLTNISRALRCLSVGQYIAALKVIVSKVSLKKVLNK